MMQNKKEMSEIPIHALQADKILLVPDTQKWLWKTQLHLDQAGLLCG